MKRNEAARLLTVIAAAYPNFEPDDDKVRIWAEMMADLEYETAATALQRHIATSRFAPTIAEIREQAVAAVTSSEITSAEAWGELMHAVRAHGYYHEREALASLSPITARVAGIIGWRDINMCTELDVLRGQFLRMYRLIRERNAREAVLPPWLLPPAPSPELASEGRRQIAAAGVVVEMSRHAERRDANDITMIERP